ncbi:MAG: hypothetical protein KUG73_03765, partial [Pseudomonadales bacterium]|nr:hypothetical protein [Pseudomonadales bacterium]
MGRTKRARRKQPERNRSDGKRVSAPRCLASSCGSSIDEYGTRFGGVEFLDPPPPILKHGWNYP